MAKWQNVQAELYIELENTGDGWQIVDGKSAPEGLAKWLQEQYSGCIYESPLELTVNVSSTGYYDPGKTYGPPEDCYPPEGDNERPVTGAGVAGYEVPKTLFDEIEEWLSEEIEALEIMPPEPDYED